MLKTKFNSYKLSTTSRLIQTEEWPNTTCVTLIAAGDNAIEEYSDTACKVSRILCRRPVTIVANIESSTIYFSNSFINSIKPWYYKS